MSKARRNREASITQLPQAGAITRLSAQYAHAFPLRSLIQGIPYVGGSLDTILAGLGSRWQHERLSAFLSLLDRRLRKRGRCKRGRWFKRNFSIGAPEERNQGQVAAGEAGCCPPPMLRDPSLSADRKPLSPVPLFGYNPHRPRASGSV